MIDEKSGFIDLLWKGVILIEHKSRGKDLDRAYQQAKDYFPGLKKREISAIYWKVIYNALTRPEIG